ncbi:MAG: AMMECR1 domain-containing protein, partial [Pirellulales bacterium]|nr:AMMECR1 domain-containing protein [Pirellulales bacterium]
LGTHGIYITHGNRSGCFLPEVATDQGWNTEEFLGFCCSHKAGLPHDAWKDPATKVYLFTSHKFSDFPA